MIRYLLSEYSVHLSDSSTPRVFSRVPLKLAYSVLFLDYVGEVQSKFS